MRRATPKPCIGPRLLSVLSTSKSSAPYGTSILASCGLSTGAWPPTCCLSTGAVPLPRRALTLADRAPAERRLLEWPDEGDDLRPPPRLRRRRRGARPAARAPRHPVREARPGQRPAGHPARRPDAAGRAHQPLVPRGLEERAPGAHRLRP